MRAGKGGVLNAFAAPEDGKGELAIGEKRRRVDLAPPKAMERGRLRIPAPTGVRAIDAFTPLCQGQRIGIIAGSGVGKSTPPATIALRAKVLFFILIDGWSLLVGSLIRSYG